MHILGVVVAGLLQVAASDSNWIVEHDVAVPMRDGVVLRADVYRPPNGGPFPVLVYRTPYGKHEVVRSYTTVQHAIERGYAVVAQDVRGRYASAGTFVAYQRDGKDGYDTIEWAAAQPWSNGAVGTFGLSYPGAVQWLAAVELPPHLRAMVPAMTYGTPQQFFYSGGVWDLSWAPWVWNNIAPDLRARTGTPGPKTGEEAREAWKHESARVFAQRPLLDLPDFKAIAPWYYEWLLHEPSDAWWEWARIDGRFDRVDAAVLNLSGWHDETYGSPGAIANFAGLVQARGAANARTKLLIGPWQHGVGATGRTKAGERQFGANAAIDYDETVLRWMDRWLKGIDNGIDREPAVRVYVMGANEWRTADRWPLPGLRSDTLWLAAGGQLTPTAPRLAQSSSSYVSDPSDPVRDPGETGYGAYDLRSLATRSDVLSFETAPFDAPMEVIGTMTAEIQLEADAPDVDVFVKVLDVGPDGTAYNLMSPGREVLRASYRDMAKGRQLLEPGRTYTLRISDLNTANRFEAGHRLRVQVMSSFHPHLSVNPQTGELERNSAALRKARVTIRHDATHQSRLIIPVMPAR